MARRLVMALVLTFSASLALADSPANLLDTYKTQAKVTGGAAGDVARGQSFF
jgi:ABC-type dipeptide/oligopeptide/nickel transport system ATPase component